jgi:hypothetical protein
MPLIYASDEEYLELMEILDGVLHDRDNKYDSSVDTDGYAEALYARCAIMYGLPWEEAESVEEEENADLAE